ncbi:hypothetical protein F5Y15DRAFT_418510 [Xylariaceae sp. FL0016]|nr:hypothetical protein F5Y15DRAFT_418510 [Xylariaceae sp. FL0016]
MAAVSSHVITPALLAAFVAILALTYLNGDTLKQLAPSFPPSAALVQYFPLVGQASCAQQDYTTEIISLDPLLIYIRKFFNEKDIAGILAAGENRFNPSEIYQNGRMIQNPYRTSWSAGLPAEEPAVKCVLERAKEFLGAVLDPTEDEMGIPQLVRYTSGQQYNLHHDWLRMPQAAFDGSPRSFNRVASFFVILQDDCTEGETWFPFVKPASAGAGSGSRDALWREHEGGLAFKPVAGNALFWINLFPNGTGDSRTVHAGLPVTGGLKTAMNIWPRQYRSNEEFRKILRYT